MTTKNPDTQKGRIPLAYAKAVTCADGETRDGWALPCGCLVHYFDEAQDGYVLPLADYHDDDTSVDGDLRSSERVIRGNVAPHLHVSVGCSLH